MLQQDGRKILSQSKPSLVISGVGFCGFLAFFLRIFGRLAAHACNRERGQKESLLGRSRLLLSALQI